MKQFAHVGRRLFFFFLPTTPAPLTEQIEHKLSLHWICSYSGLPGLAVGQLDQVFEEDDARILQRCHYH